MLTTCQYVLVAIIYAVLLNTCLFVSNQAQDAMFNALGIASGNAATLVPLLMMALLPIIYLYLQVLKIFQIRM